MKTKENKGSLYLIIVLTLAILMLFGISMQSVLAETKENIEEELEILSAYDSIVVDGETIDMTEYKEKTLPDEPMENIDSGNIDEYVPKELFNRGSEPIIYCGNHYGFVIQEDSRTNTVLLFKIETRPMTEYDDGYYVKVAVVFEKSFLMVLNNITPLATLNHLAIGVNGVQQTILDDQIGVAFAEYKPEQDTGPFLIEFDYGSLATEVESGDFFEGMKSYMIDLVVDTAVAAISAAVPGAGPALNVAVALGTIAGESASKFVVHNNKNNEYVFPKNREDQLNSLDTNYTLLKSYEADVINSDEFFLTYNDNQMNYLEMSFHINNPDKARYYVYNLLKLSALNYRTADSVQTVKNFGVECLFNASSRSLAYTNVEKAQSGEGFDLTDGNNFIPVFDGYVYNLQVGDEGNYGITEIDGYDVVVEGILPGVDGTYHFESGKRYRIAIVSEGKEAVFPEEPDGEAVAPQYDPTIYFPTDFEDRVVTFVNLAIWRNQTLSLDSDSAVLADELAYARYICEKDGAPVFELTADKDLTDVEFVIADENFEILAESSLKGNKLVVNYPMTAGEAYYLICSNNGQADISVTLTEKADLVLGDTDYEGVPMYYRVDAKYTQNYHVYGDVEDICVAGGESLQAGYEPFFQSGESYYILSSGADIYGVELGIAFADEAKRTAYMGNEYEFDYGLNEVFSHYTEATAIYKFVGGACDLYCDGMLVAENADSALLVKDKIYTIVTLRTSGVFAIEPDATTLQYNVPYSATNAPQYSAYSIELEQRTRIAAELSNGSEYAVYDSVMQEIDYDHGYDLNAGKYYIVVNEDGSYTIEVNEYLQPVTINLVVDGQPYNDASGQTYYYGKPFKLPTPQKDRYDFGGWKDGDTIVTDEDGNSFSAIYEDEITLTAHWVLRGLVMEIDMGNGDAKWWTGDSIEDAQPDAVYLEDDFIRLLIDLKDDYVAMPDGSGNKEGHFLSTFTYEKESSVGNVDYYVFEPVWVKERYFVEFIYNNEGLGITTEFNGAPTSSWPTIAFGGGDFDSYYEVWSLPGGGTKEFVMGRQIGDLTPGVGSEFDFDSDNDGVDDATYLRLIPIVNEVAYCVEINGRLFDLVDGQLTLASSLASYGFNESSYYGKAVWLTADTDDGKLDCNFGSVITKNMLSMFWDEGEHEVQVEFDLSSRLLTYLITYSGATGSSITSYKVGDSPIALASDIRNRGWKFEGWRYGNKTITKVSRDELGLTDIVYDMSKTSLNITITAKFTRTSYEINTFGSLTVTGEVSYVDCNGVGINVFGNICIASSVKEVTLSFRGSSWEYSKITVEDRGNADLIINFDNGIISAPIGQPALNASEVTGNLELYSSGEITIEAADARQDASAPAVTVGGNVTISGETFVIRGANQVNESVACPPATEGITGGTGSSTMKITAKSVSVYGGNGIDGYDGYDGEDATGIGQTGGGGALAGDGGDGASAMIYNGEIRVAAGSALYCKGGNGGNGGNGCNGGQGGPGDDGELFGATTIPSGDGGRGGAAGDGGDAGNGIEAKVIYGTYIAEAGTLGKAGAFGKGGAPGEPPGYTVFDNPKYGANGEDGKEGKDGAVGYNFVVI